MSRLIVIFVVLVLSCNPALAGDWQGFFSRVAKPDSVKIQSATEDQPLRITKWRPIVNIPAIKITESTREDSSLDAAILPQVGGGVSIQYLQYDADKERWDNYFSWSPLTVLLSGNSGSGDTLDLSYATTVGFFDNLILFGLGYDFGSLEDDRSRVFGLISIGINFNN